MENEIQLPIDHFSYSSMTQLLRNPIIFKMKYILGVYDTQTGISGMVGRAAHEALKAYYGGCDECVVSADKEVARHEAIDWGLNYLEKYDDAYIDYGKTGSRELMLRLYTKAMQNYFAEEPEYNEILMVEEKMKGEMYTIDGDQLALPGTGIPDIVHKRKDGGIEIIDTKFVKSFTDYESEDYIKIIQSQFLYHLLRGVKDWTADRMLFREIKITDNQMDKVTGKVAPQVRDYAIPFNHEPYRIMFYNIYNDCVKYLANNPIFLPNLSDMFDGEQAGLVYAQGLINADMTDVEVMHKVKDLAFTSKKFMSSRLDSVENKHLLPEEKIKIKLAEFGIPVEPMEKIVSATITQYRFKVSAGIRMSVFEKHRADITNAIAAKGSINILAPIPGTSFVGIEVANEVKGSITLEKEHLTPDTMILPLGVNIQGEVVKVALNSMPHLLIAGSTGSGKSVLLHSILESLVKQMSHEHMSLVLIDPKRVELVAFAKKKHLQGGKIIHEYETAMNTLNVLADEMDTRYKMLEKAGKRDINEYNAKAKEKMNYIVVVIDEFADVILQGKAYSKRKKDRESLQMASNKASVEGLAKHFAKMGIHYNPKIGETNYSATAEELIARLASMARAVGIHLIIATQRPSADIITGLIKANFPTRIALTTASEIDSRVILGDAGAEKLSGKGDMILMSPGMPKTRLQGFMIKQK